jgi:aminomethyltransferase
MTERTTPFVEHHRAAGGKLVPFAGFLMPLQYDSIVAEHEAVRRRAGVFDVSHMGEFWITGPEAVAFADRLVTNHVAAAEPGQAVYTPMCEEGGGIVDDLLVYRFPDRVLLVVNAANIESDWAHVLSRKPAGARLENRSAETAQLAVQGPRAADLLAPHLPPAARDLGYYRFLEGEGFGVPMLVSRTGYTGEDGFELYFDARHGGRVWTRLLEAGAPYGLAPAGLGARDVLRLEMGYCLYGNDIDRTTNPLEAGLGWTVKLEKPDFVGRDALVRVRERGLGRQLAGFTVHGPRLARHGMAVVQDGQPVGRVTSGTFSPALSRGIGMAYLPRALSRLGTAIEVDAGRTRLAARVERRPFVEGSHHGRKGAPGARAPRAGSPSGGGVR